KRREARYATVDSMREDVERAREELAAAAAAAGQRPSRGGLAAAQPPSGMGMANGNAINVSGPAITPSRLAEAVPQERREEGSSAQPRLKREDFDAFERSLRRRSLLNVVLAPLLFVVLGGAFWGWWHWKQAQPRVEEREPDNELGQATLIATGSPVKGKI